ncbi:MAG: hypothetical protein ACTSU2_08525 [Promethearchaeota archaeon]
MKNKKEKLYTAELELWILLDKVESWVSDDDLIDMIKELIRILKKRLKELAKK